MLHKLTGIITEVIKFYQAHIFPNWIQHLLYGQEWSSPNLFVLNKNFNNDNINSSSRGNETDHKMWNVCHWLLFAEYKFYVVFMLLMLRFGISYFLNECSVYNTLRKWMQQNKKKVFIVNFCCYFYTSLDSVLNLEDTWSILVSNLIVTLLSVSLGDIFCCLLLLLSNWNWILGFN